MTFWDFVDGLIRNPPAIFAFFLVAVLVAHVFKIALEFLTKQNHPNVLIATLEILLVVVLSYIILHLYLSPGVEAHKPTESNPLVLVFVLIFFTAFSMLVYLFFHLIRDSGRGPEPGP